MFFKLLFSVALQLFLIFNSFGQNNVFISIKVLTSGEQIPLSNVQAKVISEYTGTTQVFFSDTSGILKYYVNKLDSDSGVLHLSYFGNSELLKLKVSRNQLSNTEITVFVDLEGIKCKNKELRRNRVKGKKYID